jgi:putative membrane protein
MLIKWVVAALHVLAFGFALAAVLARGRALRRLRTDDPRSFRDVFVVDNIWGVSAGLLLITGAFRAFGGLEKGSFYYLHQPLFHLKMTAFVAILALEIVPMFALIKWRIAFKRNQPIDTSHSRRFARISHMEAALMVIIVIAATGMARGILLS